ncbi:MAG: hypothetical protein F6K10_20330 [Moorea sp. SIO2B7]|nr:hypothetical protein [Moorena sp. SIO2B7]
MILLLPHVLSSRPTLYKWQRQLETTGSTAPKVPGPPTWVSKIKDWKKFLEFVEQHGNKTQEEMAILWGNCSRHTISRGLKKMALHHCGMIGKFLLGFKSNLIPAITFSENNKI